MLSKKHIPSSLFIYLVAVELSNELSYRSITVAKRSNIKKACRPLRSICQHHCGYPTVVEINWTGFKGASMYSVMDEIWFVFDNPYRFVNAFTKNILQTLRILRYFSTNWIIIVLITTIRFSNQASRLHF